MHIETLLNKGQPIKQLFLIFSLIFFIIELGIIFGGLGLMGVFGHAVFEFNFKLFGIFSYFYPLGIIYLGYLFYKEKKFTLRLAEIYIASVFFLMLLLILQASVFKIGIFGLAVISYLQAYLGLFGIWVLSLLGIGVCLISLADRDVIQIFQALHPFFERFCSRFIPLISRFYSLFKEKFSALTQKISSLKFTPQISQSPFIEIPQNTQVDLKNLLPPLEENQEEIPKVQPKKEKTMFKKDEKMILQEVIVAELRQEKKTQIRVVEGAQPQKENPFLKSEFYFDDTHEVSSSAQLLQKIKNQNTPKPSNAQIASDSAKVQTPTAPTKTSSPHLHGSYASSLHSLDVHEALNPAKADQDEESSDFKKEIDFSHRPFIQSSQEAILSSSYSQETEHTKDQQDLIEAPLTPTALRAQENLPVMEENFDLPKESLAQSSNPPRFSQVSLQSAKRAMHIKSLEENEALLKEIDQGNVVIPKDYKLPPISLLSPAPAQESEVDESEIDFKIQSLLTKLAVFKIEGDVIRTYSGPIITTLEFRPAPNVKVSRIQSLENDIAMALEAKSIRIQAPIPGKNVVGIEIPNSTTQTIYLREIFESEIFQNSASPLTLALGKDVVGNPFITDLRKLPHLLIAGTTGSGKSVGVNAMILSLLYRNSPDDLKLMMIDPKMVEFMPYSDLPHLVTPIITDPKKAVIGLANAVKEMERRYTLMSQSRTKEIMNYNQKAEELGLEKFPFFVIIIDELADLMMTAGKEVEYSMARIAQMGRASGIHLIVATQSPRAEVLTGLIKTNLPAHLSYKVGTKIDAGIIGCAGAETLLGRGDMLFTPPGVSGLVRLHAPWSSEDEVNEIIAFIKEQREVVYDPQFLPEERETFGSMDCELDEEMTQLVQKAHQIILQDGKTSISYLQRRLSIGYNKAATIIEKLTEMGILSEPDTKGNRQIL